MRRSLMTLPLLLALAACDDGLDNETVATGPDLDVTEAPPLARQSRRMTVQQLRGTLPAVFGNDAEGNPITWTLEQDGQAFELLSPFILGPTLGHPDYINVKHEAAEASTLFVKLSADMARNVCTQAVVADASKPEADRAVMRFADVDENLLYLHLRFLGRRVTAEDASVQGLRRVYDAAYAETEGNAENKNAVGWQSVCIALLESPAFYIY